MPWSKVKKRNRLLGVHKKRNGPVTIRRFQPIRGKRNISEYDIWEETSLPEDEFENLYQTLLRKKILYSRKGGSRKSKTVLSGRLRLLMVLHWLREKPKFRILAKKFKVSVSVAHRDVVFFLPKLTVATNGAIAWPGTKFLGWQSTIGSLDCTAHPRTRVHPRQADWYRRDKGFNMLAQVVVGHDSRIYQVDLMTGHNNDRGAFDISGLKAFLVSNNEKLLADSGMCQYNCVPTLSGYSHHLLVTPEKSQNQQWQNTQKGLRAVVETVIGLVKNWEVARDRFRGHPELHALALRIVYQLTAVRLLQSPLRQ